MSHADGIWVAHVAEEVSGMETRRRKTGNHWGHQKRAEKSEKMRRKPAPGRGLGKLMSRDVPLNWV